MRDVKRHTALEVYGTPSPPPARQQSGPISFNTVYALVRRGALAFPAACSTGNVGASTPSNSLPPKG